MLVALAGVSKHGREHCIYDDRTNKFKATLATAVWPMKRKDDIVCAIEALQKDVLAAWRLSPRPLRPFMASDRCYRGAPQNGTSLASIKKWYVVVFFVFFFEFFLSVHHESLRLPQPDTCADRLDARIHRAASDMLLVTCKWRYCRRFWPSILSVVFRLVRSWLF